MILKKLNELENLIDVPNVDENSEQSIKAMKMLNTINDIRKAVKNNAVLQHVSGSAAMPEGFRIYKCTDCGAVNVKKDNGNIRVGFCDECEHPLWN